MDRATGGGADPRPVCVWLWRRARGLRAAPAAGRRRAYRLRARVIYYRPRTARSGGHMSPRRRPHTDRTHAHRRMAPAHYGTDTAFSKRPRAQAAESPSSKDVTVCRTLTIRRPSLSSSRACSTPVIVWCVSRRRLDSHAARRPRRSLSERRSRPASLPRSNAIVRGAPLSRISHPPFCRPARVPPSSPP